MDVTIKSYMKFVSRFLLKFVFVISILFLQSGFAYALDVCPGVTKTLTWTVTSGTCTSFPRQFSDNPLCQFLGAGGSKNVTLSAGQSCYVEFKCTNNGVDSNLSSDTLKVVNSSLCCNTGSQVGLPYWNGSSCQQYDTPWCQDGTKHGGAKYDFISNPTAGYCGCTAPRTDIGGTTGCACPTGTIWNGVLGAGATCTNPTAPVLVPTSFSCSGTIPANAVANNISPLTASGAYGYSATAGNCKYQCSASAHWNNASCVVCYVPTPNWNQTTLSCVAGATVPSATISVSPTTIAYNTASTITWSASANSVSCTAGGVWGNSGNLSGSGSTLALTTNRTYTYFCTNPTGNSATVSATVNGWGGAKAVGGGREQYAYYAIE